MAPYFLSPRHCTRGMCGQHWHRAKDVPSRDGGHLLKVPRKNGGVDEYFKGKSSRDRGLNEKIDENSLYMEVLMRKSSINADVHETIIYKSRR